MSHEFPSLEWMQAYAASVAEHPQAAGLSEALTGRYRFVIDPDGPVRSRHAYDLVVAEGEWFEAEVAGDDRADLVVTAGYGRWRGLLTGRADFVMSFLMRKIKVDGDVGAVRKRLSDAKPLLDCLREVPTTFPD